MLRISPYSFRMRENAGKVQTRITPNTDSFYAVMFIDETYNIVSFEQSPTGLITFNISKAL